jgi:hypothetical protein
MAFANTHINQAAFEIIFLMSAPPNLAPGVLTMLFHTIFAETMSAILVVSL